MDPKDGKTANDIAALAESLADRIEAGIAEPDRTAGYEAAALLFGAGALRVHRSGELLIDPTGSPARMPRPFDGALRGRLPRAFGSDAGLSIALAERVFDGWGWDIIKWPREQGGVPAGAKITDGVPAELPEGAYVYDAEITPTKEFAATVAGRSLVGQHVTAGGALLAAILRGYAYKVKHDAGVLAPQIDFDLTDEERGFVADIVDRAEELEISPPAARVDRMTDIAAVHKNGCPLDLESFLHVATDYDFTADFRGIAENVDRTTGKLKGEWRPKYAQTEPARFIGVDSGAPGGDYSATVTGSVDEQGKFKVETTETEPTGEHKGSA